MLRSSLTCQEMRSRPGEMETGRPSAGTVQRALPVPGGGGGQGLPLGHRHLVVRFRVKDVVGVNQFHYGDTFFDQENVEIYHWSSPQRREFTLA